jgi:hypothetical protein
MPWHPPIPAGKLYSAPALQLGTGLALLVYLYDGVQRDGWVDVSLEQAAADLGVPYRTVKDWWKRLREGPFFSDQQDRGKRGWRVRLADDWLDWHVMANNYPEKFHGRTAALDGDTENASRPTQGQKVALDSDTEDASRPVQGRDTALDGDTEEASRHTQGRHAALEMRQGPVKALSRPTHGRDAALEGAACKEDQHDQESRLLRAIRAPPSEHQQLMHLYAEGLGYQLTTATQEAVAAKKILAAGYTPEQAIDVYRTLKADIFWQGKHLSLQTVYKQMGAVLQAPKVGTNGTRTYRNGQHPDARDEWPGFTAWNPDEPL